MRLVDASKDRPVWSGSYEGELKDVLGLQTKVAEAIAEEIHVALTAPDRARIFRDRRVNLDAYNAYLKGRHQYFSGYTQESTEKAIAWFHQALDLDPSYAPAYAALADCYWGLSNVYYPPTEAMPKAKWAALKALELDDSLAEAHAMLALVRSSYEFKRAEADKGFKRAIELKSSDAQVHLLYGIHLAEMGGFDEAVSEVEQAEKLDPVSPFMNGYVALPLYFAHRYDEAIQRLQPVIEMHPNYHHPHALLALAYERKGLWSKAIPEMERAYELDRDQDGLAQLGHMYAVSGRTADAIKVLGQLQELSRRRYVSAYNIAVLYTGLGQKDEAFRWLQKVEEDRSEWFGGVNVDPRLDSLHSDPRFASILRSVGLAP
jgi:tetratricopeptide (TPR) repeat protein